MNGVGPGGVRIAFLFPGQGSQAPGMGRDLAASYPEAAAVFARADSVLGFSISRLCFEGAESDLKPTEVAQPALLTCSIAALRCVEAQGIRPTAAAGHSLGEYPALVAAGVLTFDDALRLVRTRGLLMAAAAEQQPGAMAAVLGLDPDGVGKLCESCAAIGAVAPANFNAPGQVVVSGTADAVKAVVERAKAAGATRAVSLAVSGAFHSPLMQSAANAMESELAQASMSPARVPVVSNTTAAASQDPDTLRAALVAQIASAVRWEESVRTLAGLGVTHYLELGSGKVLCGLVRRIVPGADVHAAADPAGMESLEAFCEAKPEESP